MKPPEGMGSEAWFGACVDTATDLPLDESVRGDFLAGLSVLGGLVHDREMIANLISKEGLMDLIRIDDLQRLKQLHRAAIQATSLEAFERMLDDV